MLPRAVRHEVAAPAVSQLVGNDIDILAVLVDKSGQRSDSSISPICRCERAHLGDDTGGGKGEDGVLHATVGEAWRQDENIIFTPDIRVDNFLHQS